ncbi:CoB--CoM heterodisulfide reductase iron-sulfur subunit B family protein [Mesoterricola sediminis]|uniref:Heterodisulfide reductase subunit B n=1 Tax=Mesoterricola sediminis TaxID=2927980 RepID=A0AA48HHR1_9BACT|nr:CoB--CoM heterodisulfide reductase iron-sulfur subunit B family protein [Mesoterricola sediminis]BDU78438.1 heterodisulfide reductase subunit B [Mesoterricola sediminis]
MRMGYYPGCSLLGSSREFDESVRAVAAALDLDLVQVPDWNCCGASSAHVLDAKLAAALPARILAQAAEAGLDEVLAPCAACYNRLVSAQQALAKNPAFAEEIAGITGAPAATRVRVLNVLEVLDRLRDTIQARVKTPFGRKVACYYGCLLVRPPRVVAFDRPEDPRSMDLLAEAAGAVPLPWSHKTECCGASFSVTRTDIVAKLSGRVLDAAVKAGAEAVLVACPMCQSNLDMRRPEINAHLGRELDIPVLYITQALGLALDLDPEKLGLHRHMVPAMPARA